MNKVNVLLISLVFIFSCATPKTTSEEKIDRPERGCFKDRNDTGNIEKEEGEIILVGGYYLIKTNSTRYWACNLPISYNQEDLKIQFTGVIKETRPNERLMGTPFEIIEIKSM